MARKSNPFKLRSGNASSFKMMGSSAFKDDEKEDKSVDDTTTTTNEPTGSDDDSATDSQNMSFDVPSKDDFQIGDDLTGTDYTYTASGKDIVRRDDTSDIDPNLKPRDKKDHSKTDDIVKPGYDEVRYTGSKGQIRHDITHPTVDPETGKSQGGYTLIQKEHQEGRHKGGKGPTHATKYDTPIANDPFADDRVIGYDAEGNIEFADMSEQYGQDIYIPSGTTQSDMASINTRKYDDRYDKDPTFQGDWQAGGAPEMAWAEGLEGAKEDVTGRTKTSKLDIQAGDYEGDQMRLIEGTRGGDKGLIAKKTIYTDDGRIKEKHKHKKGGKGSVSVNPDTGKLEWSKKSIVSKRDVFNPETGKYERKKYINGREVTDEYKEDLKTARKEFRGSRDIFGRNKAAKKAAKLKKEHEFRNKAMIFNEESGEWEKNPDYRPMV
tara:strand:+ start:1244 stop:2548 length:1305 start_codon:yes stop_codon:yes gene_type:complete